MKMKKWIIISISVFLVINISLTGFFVTKSFRWKEIQIKLNPDYNELFSQEEMKERGHKSLILEYTSDISVGYKKEDGTKSVYVYATPIRFQDSSGQLSLIDTRITNLRDAKQRAAGYLYTVANSDIKPFFPKQITSKNGIVIDKDISYELGVYSDKPILGWFDNKPNFIGDKKNMIIYKNAFGIGDDICFYPSSLGANCEIDLTNVSKTNSIKFWLKIPDENVKLKKEPGGYLVMTKDKKNEQGISLTEIVGVIQKPILKDTKGTLSYDCSIAFTSKSKGFYDIDFVFNSALSFMKATAFISFEMRRVKQPDNTLYSKQPNLVNAYLSNYYIVGNDMNYYGIGRTLIRNKFVKILNLQSSQIKEAYYYAYSLSHNKDQFELLSVLEDWCSLTGNWSKNYKTGRRTSLLNLDNKTLKFNITEEVKKWCNNANGQMEHNGLMFKSTEEKEGIYNIILSNDNSLYKNVTEVILK